MHKKISEKRIDGALEVLYDAEKIYNDYKASSIKIGIKHWCYLCSTLAVSAVEDSDYRKKYRGLLFRYFIPRMYMLNLKCFIRLELFVKTYNTRYKFEDDIKLPVTVRNNQMIEVKREVRRAILRDKFRNFWKK